MATLQLCVRCVDCKTTTPRTPRDVMDSVGACTATLHSLCVPISPRAPPLILVIEGRGATRLRRRTVISSVVAVQIAYKARQCENILWYTAVIHIEMRCHEQRVRAEACNVIRISL